MARLLAAAALVACALQPAATGWVESYDKKSNKKFYYDEETRKTQWEKPDGVDIKFLDDDPTVGSGSTKQKGAGAVTVLAAVMTPVVLVFGGLALLYWRVRCRPTLRHASLASAAPPCCRRRCRRRALRTHAKFHRSAHETDPPHRSQASGQGLGEALSAMKKKRDRSQKRRSTKAGSGFKQKQKLSQDGKGGRSANS